MVTIGQYYMLPSTKRYRSAPFQGANRGSIPLGSTKANKEESDSLKCEAWFESANLMVRLLTVQGAIPFHIGFLYVCRG